MLAIQKRFKFRLNSSSRPKLSLMLMAIAGSFFVAISCVAASGGWQSTVPDARQPRPKSIQNPGLIQIQGEINRPLAQYFKNRFNRARRDGVDLLVVEIDSPGGLKIESLQMARALRDCKFAYTVCLIRNEAISGGALISLGCDEIFIDPNAKFGDIGEIGFDAEAFTWRLIEPKVESYLSRDARDLAESKGRPADLAEAMVDKDVLVYTKHKGDVLEAPLEFQLTRVDANDKPDEPWTLVPETGPERFLTLSGQRAKELGIAQHFAVDREGLANELGLNSNQFRIYRRTTTDTIVYLLNNPFVTGLLVIVGLIALYVEFSAPGIGAGGLLAGLCAILFFWSRFFGGTSGWLEVILFIAGLIFLAMEIFVIPGFGFAGLSGLALLFSSVILASQDFTWPKNAEQWNQSLTTSLMILCSGCLFLIAAAFISRRLDAIPIFNRLVLSPENNPSIVESVSKDEHGKPIPQPHPQLSVGDWGKSESLLRPAGRARFAGNSFDVISDGSFVDPGTQVRVVRVNGNVITVTPIDDAGTETTYRET